MARCGGYAHNLGTYMYTAGVGGHFKNTAVKHRAKVTPVQNVGVCDSMVTLGNYCEKIDGGDTR